MKLMTQRFYDGRNGVPWFMTGLVVGMFIWAVGPSTGSSSTVPDVVELELPAQGDGPGHGSYCLIPGAGAYFYGRDLRGEVSGTEAFANWCELRGGTVGWIE